MRILYGKGIWAWQEKEVSLAIDTAHAIGARVILFKTGQEGEYFTEAARRVVKRVLDAGLVPVAWPVITCWDPEAESEVAIQTVLDGYAGLVFDIGKPASRQYDGATRLGELMLETELPPEVMFFTSLPNISANLDIPYAEMSRFCHGGFMPQAYASFGWDPQYTLDVVAYREFRMWCEAHELERPVYPVLGLYRDAYGRSPLHTDELRAWCEVLSGYKPTFFSVYRASAVPKAAWPLLAEIQTTPEGQAPHPTPRVEGEYITVRPGDTVAKLCARHNCSWDAFWAWNGHLWDAQSKKHEPELMEYGWIVRVE